MIRFAYENLHIEPCSPTGYYLTLDLTADLAILDGVVRRIVLECIPPLELAVQLQRWTSAGMTAAFHYRSMQDESPSLLDIEPEGTGWRVSSVWGDTPSSVGTTADLAACIEAFIAQLRADCASMFRIDLEPYLRGELE